MNVGDEKLPSYGGIVRNHYQYKDHRIPIKEIPQTDANASLISYNSAEIYFN